MFKIFFWLFMVFAVLSAIFGIGEGTYLGSYSARVVWNPTFEVLKDFSRGAWWAGAAGAFMNLGAQAAFLLKILSWNYVMLDTGLGLVAKELLFWPLSASVLITLFLAMLKIG